MTVCFLNAKIGDQFKIGDNQATYVKIQPIKGGKSCKCKTMANAIQLGYESRAEIEKGKWTDLKQVPNYAQAFAANYEILPPSDRKPIIVSGFPAIGKTTFNKQTLFASELLNTTFNRNFPNLFNSKVEIDLPKVEFLIVPFDEKFRIALQNAGREYILVHPDNSLKNEYINRYSRNRNLAKTIEEEWDNYISSCKADNCEKIVLGSREFLTKEIFNK